MKTAVHTVLNEHGSGLEREESYRERKGVV